MLQIDCIFRLITLVFWGLSLDENKLETDVRRDMCEVFLLLFSLCDLSVLFSNRRH